MSFSKIAVLQFACLLSAGVLFALRTVSPTPVPLTPGTITTGNQSVPENAVPATLFATAATGGSCSGSYQYQWQYSYNDTLYRDLDSCTIGDSLHFEGSLERPSFFRRRVVCGSDTLYTSSVAVDILLSFSGGYITTPSQFIDSNTVPPVINASKALSGNCGGAYTYQWQISSDGYVYNNIPGADSRNLDYGTALSGTTYFRRKAFCDTQYAYTSPVVIRMNTPPPVIPARPRNEIDSLLDSQGINVQSLFNIYSDSIANSRPAPNPALDSLDIIYRQKLELAPMGNSYTGIDSSDLQELAEDSLQDNIQQRLLNDSLGITDSTLQPLFIPLIDDSTIQHYLADSNYHGLDSLVHLAPQVSLEDAVFQMEQVLLDSQTLNQRTYIPAYSSSVYKRGAVINGLSIVGFSAAAGTPVRYTGSFQFPTGSSPGSIFWVVNNGVIVSQNTDPSAGPLYVDVLWPNNASLFVLPTSVMLIDISSRQVDVLPVYRFTTDKRVYPALQKVFYGQTPCILQAASIVLGIGHGIVNNVYQWQQLDVYSNNPVWTDIPGATGSGVGSIFPTYQPGPLARPWMMYRCALMRYSGSTLQSTTYTSAASIQMEKPDGGTIAAASTDLAFNTVPTITETPSTGGFTEPGHTLNYSWEYSVNGGPWTSFGNGQSYPGYAIRYSNTRIRRLIYIGGTDAVNDYVYSYSNEINFTTHYQSVDFENRNYIRENVVRIRGVEHWEDADLLANEDKSQVTTYLDGLSRPVQTVAKGTYYDASSHQWSDLVQSVTYEAGGRVDRSLLPYATADNPGKFKTDAAVAQPAYYQAQFGDNKAFVRVEYDNSPMNQVLKSYAPGESWTGSNVNVSGNIEVYQPSVDKIRLWTIGYSEGEMPVSTQRYGFGTDLVKTWVLDEKNKKVITYTDRNGKLVLKKVQLAEGSQLSTQHDGWLCTYYVYDDLNRLRFTITPKAVKAAEANGWVLTQMMADELCFWYDYDDLGRAIAKKTPGKGIEYIVYDNRNRPVFTQDANARAKGEWMTVFYDQLNRPVMNAIYKSAQTRTNLQTAVSSASASVVNLATTYGGTIQACYTTFTTSDINNTALFTQLSFHYYDGYDFNGKQDPVKQNMAYSSGYEDRVVEERGLGTGRTAGMPTGSKTRVLDGATTPLFLNSTVYYDEEGRSLQTLSDNIKGGTDISSAQYHFDGRILSTLETHNNPGTGYASFPIMTKYRYDKSGRVSDIGKKINSTTRNYVSSGIFSGSLEDDDADYKFIANYKYNELGRMVKKVLSPDYNNGSGLEVIRYAYNMRGWLTGINEDYALNESGDQWQHYFGIHIGYDNRNSKFAAAQLNGQITGVQWKSQGDNTARKYDYVYDNANRLLAANFKQYNGSAWANDRMDFSTKDLTYDENGNLMTLTHMGVLPGASAPIMIDQLAYTYNPHSNKLFGVIDGNTNPANGKLGDFKDGPYATTMGDYGYDANGNLKSDNNKDIYTTTYNYLDKPELITLSSLATGISAGTIRYIYAAGGSKLQKIVTENPTTANGNQTIVTTTTYIGNYVYTESSTNTAAGMQLQFILHEEGRIRVIKPYENVNDPANLVSGGFTLPNGRQGVYDYFIKDHLQNVRATITEEINKASGICTMEDADTDVKQYEEAAFGNPGTNNEVNLTRDDIPSAWASMATTGNLKVSKLQAQSGTPQTGPNTLLRVMAGDKISARVDYYYANNPGSSGAGSTGLTAMINSLLASLTGNKATELAHGESGVITGALGNNVPLQTFYNQQPSNGNTSAPRAYLNWIFLDEQFNYVSQGSGSLRVEQDGDGADPLVMTEEKAVRNGYVYVYLSNESGEAVYFDNFTVSHERGQLIGEDHYYAYGLRIAAISSRSISSSLNLKMVSYGYQGSYSEELSEFGLNYNEFFLRTYDPQIGRWTTPDPFDQFASPYIGMGGDPAMNTDPSGGSVPIWPIPPTGLLAGAHVGAMSLIPNAVGATASTLSTSLTILSQTISMLTIAGCIFSNQADVTLNNGTSVQQTLQSTVKSLDEGDNNYTNKSWSLESLSSLLDNACEGKTDPNRNCAMCCLNTFASNLGVLYNMDAAEFPTSGNMSDALTPVNAKGLLGNLIKVSPTIGRKRLTSNDESDFRNSKSKTNVVDKILEIVGNQEGVFIFAVGLAANYHSTLAVVVNDYVNLTDGLGGIVPAKPGKPVLLMVEDIGGGRIFTKKALESKYKEFYIGASNYYNGNRSVGGRTTTSSDKAMEAYIYQLFTN